MYALSSLRFVVYVFLAKRLMASPSLHDIVHMRCFYLRYLLHRLCLIFGVCVHTGHIETADLEITIGEN